MGVKAKTNMPNEFPQPGPELITHVPSAEELALQAAQRSHVEHTMTRGAHEAAMAGATQDAAELNQMHPIQSQYEKRPLPTVELPEHVETHEVDKQRASRAELRAIVEELRRQNKI